MSDNLKMEIRETYRDRQLEQEIARRNAVQEFIDKWLVLDSKSKENLLKTIRDAS